jgi:hypothetical protein
MIRSPTSTAVVRSTRSAAPLTSATPATETAAPSPHQRSGPLLAGEEGQDGRNHRHQSQHHAGIPRPRQVEPLNEGNLVDHVADDPQRHDPLQLGAGREGDAAAHPDHHRHHERGHQEAQRVEDERLEVLQRPLHHREVDAPDEGEEHEPRLGADAPGDGTRRLCRGAEGPHGPAFPGLCSAQGARSPSGDSSRFSNSSAASS